MIRRGEASEYFGASAGAATSDALIHMQTSDYGNSSDSQLRGETALVSLTQPNMAMVPLANQRTSRLKDTNCQLSGHGAAVLTTAFDPSGEALASGSVDTNIFLWDVYNGFENYNVLKGAHKSAVLEVKWLSRQLLVSASADKTAALWDANRGEKVRKYTDHSGIVNSVAAARDLPTVFATGSDDCTAVVWDARYKRYISCLYHDYQVTSVALSHDGNKLYTGGIDNIIRRWDLRGDTSVPDLTLSGHRDTITGLCVGPDGTSLLSNAMDCTVNLWDVNPFVAEGSSRIVRQFLGAQHGAEKNLLRCSFSSDGRFVTAGSSDRMVCVWDTDNGKLLYYLPGHKGSVNEVAFHPTEPVIASASTDKTIFAGELSK